MSVSLVWTRGRSFHRGHRMRHVNAEVRWRPAQHWTATAIVGLIALGLLGVLLRVSWSG